MPDAGAHARFPSVGLFFFRASPTCTLTQEGQSGERIPLCCFRTRGTSPLTNYRKEPGFCQTWRLSAGGGGVQ